MRYHPPFGFYDHDYFMCSRSPVYDWQNPNFASVTPVVLMLGIMMVAAPGVPGGGVMTAIGLLESMLGFMNP